MLLAASGTLETEEYSRFSGKGSLKANFEIAPPRAEASSAGRSELESEDNTAIRGAHAEGVGTSGGGESGDTGFESGDSEASQVSFSNQTKLLYAKRRRSFTNTNNLVTNMLFCRHLKVYLVEHANPSRAQVAQRAVKAEVLQLPKSSA